MAAEHDEARVANDLADLLPEHARASPDVTGSLGAGAGRAAM
jgi:hypothetical protein